MLSERKLQPRKHEREALTRDRRNEQRRERRAWKREAAYLVTHYGLVVIRKGE